MNDRKMGRAGLMVSEISLGTGNLIKMSMLFNPEKLRTANHKEVHVMSNCCRVIWALLLVAVMGMAGSDASAASTTFTLRYAAASLPADIGVQTSKRFLDLAKEKSGGRIEYKFFPGGTLGTPPDIISLTKAGSLEGYAESASFLSESIPYASCLELPLVFAEPADMWKALDGALGNKIKDDVQKKLGLKILAYVDYGSREFVMLKKSIVKAEDLKGIKVRVMPSPVLIKTYESWGAKPMQLTSNEIFNALQTGQIDGLDFPADGTIVRKFQEVAKYVTMVGLYRVVNPLTLNKKWYDGLPQDLQNIVAVSAQEAVDWGRIEQEKNRESAAKKLADLGVKVNVLSASEKAKLRSMLKPVYDMVRNDYPKEIVDNLKLP
jgi:tripartite ATP-independent transporter DctP family solute receptor